jgi:hypothetical protein
MNDLKTLFIDGAKTIDALDIYKNLKGRHIHYTNKLLKKSSELDSIEKTISNIKKDNLKVESENRNILNALKKIQKDI